MDDWVMGSLADRYSYNYPLESTPQEAEPNQWAPGAIAQQNAYTPTVKDPWKAMDAAQVSRDIVPERNMPLGVTTPQEEAVAAPQRAAPIMAAIKGAATIPKDMIEGSQRATRNGLDNSEYNPAPAVELMQLLYGVNSPFTKVGAAGAFGGRLSQTADQAALREAEELLKRGEDPAKVLKDTGFRRDIDREMKYEISDHDAQFIPEGLALARDKNVRLGQAFDWPGVYEAYPKLKDTWFRVKEDPDFPRASGYFIPGQDGKAARIQLAPRTLDEMRDVVLHEGTHGIQHIEGFATGKGGSESFLLKPGEPAYTHYLDAKRALKEGTPSDIPTIEKYRSQILDLSPPKREDFIQQLAQHEAYRRQAGEAEARNVPYRRDYTPEERRDTPPHLTLDVPYDKQTVSYPHPSYSGLGAAAERPPRMGDLAAVDRPPPGMGHNNPPPDAPPVTQGSHNPLDNLDVIFRGKQPHQFTPEDWQQFGQHYGAENIGPLSPLQTYKDMHGNEFQVPGGTEGKWTYYDTLHMKANPINPANVDRELHAELQRKLGRTMTPEKLSDSDVWNGLVFGMTSPNNPLFPNQMTASRLRLRDPKMLDDLSSMIPWKPGETPTAEARKLVSDNIAARFSLQGAPQGGLGTRGTADYSRVAEMAQMFKMNPNFFRKAEGETWTQAVERISSQLPGLSMKTGSFGTVWQNPAEAAISAVDRHMARELDKQGGIFANPAERAAWENRSANLWNDREQTRVAKLFKKTGKVEEPVLVKDFDDMLTKSGSDGFIGEMMLDHVGKALTPKFRMAPSKGGGINPNLPPHLANADWVREPETVFKIGRAYKQALDVNQKIADENGLNLFMSQWMEWDRIRNRFEPHENMFPGLSKLPAMSVEQLRAVDAAHRQTGHKTYGKTEEGTLPPTRPLKGAASTMGYLGMGGVAAMPVLQDYLNQRNQ